MLWGNGLQWEYEMETEYMRGEKFIPEPGLHQEIITLYYPGSTSTTKKLCIQILFFVNY